MLLTGDREEPIALALLFYLSIMQLIDDVVVVRHMQGIYPSLFTFRLLLAHLIISALSRSAFSHFKC